MLKFRFISVLALFAISIVLHCGQSYVAAAPASKLEKQLEKQRGKVYKELIKQYKADGWTLADNNRTMEVAVLEHLIARDANKDVKVEITGEVSKCKSMNVGRMSALNNAKNELAMQMSGQIEGMVSSLVAADVNNLAAEQDKMIAGFTNKMKASLSGAIELSYGIVKQNPDGTNHYKAFFFVDKSKCIDAASAAIEKSIQETKMSVEIADQIRDFVKNGMEIGQ